MATWRIDRNDTAIVVDAEPGNGWTLNVEPPGPFVGDVESAERLRAFLGAAIGIARGEQP